MNNADSVYAVMLTGQMDPVETDRKKRLSKLLITKFNKVLLEPTSFSDGYPACLPLWGTRLIYKKNAQTVTFDFCFDCSISAINGKKTKSFDPSHQDLLNLFIKVFPKEQELKKSKEQRMGERAQRERAKYKARTLLEKVPH